MERHHHNRACLDRRGPRRHEYMERLKSTPRAASGQANLRAYRRRQTAHAQHIRDNLSNFPMTINEVGFTGQEGARRGKRAMITQPSVLDGNHGLVA